MNPMDRRCAGITAAQGRVCAHEVVEVVADVPLCREHLRKITEALGGQVREVISGVVYYLGDPETQQVKIGSTTRLATRFANIRIQRPALVLLAAEPGYNDLERERHRRFRGVRVSHHGGNREWYRKTPELMEWVNDVRRVYGDPWQMPQVAVTIRS